MSILSPRCFEELSDMLRYAVLEHDGPIAIRYPRGSEEYTENYNGFKFGSVCKITDGEEITIFAAGRMVAAAVRAAEILGGARVVAVPTIKPIDRSGVIENISGVTAVVEDASEIGGLGSMIAEIIAEKNINTKFISFAFPDEPIVHGTVSELDRKYGLDSESIAQKIMEMKG